MSHIIKFDTIMSIDHISIHKENFRFDS